MRFIYVSDTDSGCFSFSFGHRQQWDTGQGSLSGSLKPLRGSVHLLCLVSLKTLLTHSA